MLFQSNKQVQNESACTNCKPSVFRKKMRKPRAYSYAFLWQQVTPRDNSKPQSPSYTCEIRRTRHQKKVLLPISIDSNTMME